MGKPDKLAHLTEAGRVARANARRLAMMVGIVLPAFIGAIGTALMIVWLPRVPSPMASHWSGSGQPDGFMEPVPNLLFAVATFTGMLVLMGALVLLQARPSGTAVWSSLHRLTPAFSLATMTFLMVGMVGTWQIQLDITDATGAGGVGIGMFVALGVATLAGLIGWAVQPKVRIDPQPGSRATPLDVEPGAHAAWVATVRPGTAFFVLVGGTAALTVGVAVWLYAIREPSWWISALAAVLIVAIVAMTFVFYVSVTSRGFEAKSALGWPVFRVAPEEIDNVSVSRINPLADFGGIGLRWAPGRVGIVYQAGEGMIITKTNGKIVAVTVPDVNTGAALLARYSAPDQGVTS